MHNKWYKDGLNFKCQGCGRCCTGCPGYIWVSEREIYAIAKFLNLDIQEFGSRYLRRIGNRYSLIEVRRKNDDYDCIFLDNGRCSIYSVRPIQCSTFPWWPQNLESQQAWENTSKDCPGINSNKEKTSYEAIENSLQSFKDEYLDGAN